MDTNLLRLAMVCFTLVFVVAAVFYGIYMIRAVGALKEDGKLDKDVITPNDKTFQFAFLTIIMVVLVYLAFGLGENLHGGILTLIGTLSGYVLGGHKPNAANGRSGGSTQQDS